ncbi:MAG TPA: archease [Candidatus Tectomicrobia bacterium]|jgi:SHS2 domain-containing protein
MPYEFLEDMAIADIAFRAWGMDLVETFGAAADAVMNVMLEDLDTIQHRAERQLTAEHEALDMLLFDFLQALIYYKDAEQLMLRVSQVQIAEQNGRYCLTGVAWGERLDPSRHCPRVDVKAVTLHHFSLQQSERGWAATVILDI